MLSKSINKLKDSFIHGEGLITTFLRSIVSSQAASWTDIGMSALFFSLVFIGLDNTLRTNLSVVVGALSGGIVNCCINYKFTFHANGQSVRAVIVKYALVWIGSLLLNMYGTLGVATLLSRWQFLLDLGFKPDGIFVVARLFASLMVSWFWNFALQRSFVYRPNRFDPTAIAIVDFFIPRKYKSSEHN